MDFTKGLSFSSGSVATMALYSPCVIDVTAFQTSPIVRTRNVVLTPANPAFMTLRTRRLVFGFVTTLTTISEIEIQKGTLTAVPLSMLSLPLPIMTPRPTIPGLTRARSRLVLFLPLLVGLLLSVSHYTLQHVQLGLDDP